MKTQTNIHADDSPPIADCFRKNSNEKWFIIVWLCLLFAVCFSLYTAHNSFPFWYHWDEGKKATQLENDDYYLNHPLLLLNAVRIALTATSFPEISHQSVVMVGRYVSALFAALTVVMMVLTAYMNAGVIASVMAGIFLMFNDQLFDLAHFMKEDTALIFGISVFLCMMTFYARWRTRFMAGMLGVACALALSGKYVGVICIPFGLILCAVNCGYDENNKLSLKHRFLHIAVFMFVLMAVVAAINYQVFGTPERVTKELTYEVDKLFYCGKGVSLLDILKWAPGLFLPIISMSYLFALWFNRFRSRISSYVFIALPAAYMLLLFGCVRLTYRYTLPISVFSSFLIAIAVAVIAEKVASRTHGLRSYLLCSGVVLIGMLSVLSVAIPRMTKFYTCYNGDDRRVELAEFIAANVPPGSLTACDIRVLLCDRFDRRNKVLPALRESDILMPKQWAFDHNELDIDRLKTRGVTHVAICMGYANYFMNPDPKPTRGQFAASLEKTSFYKDLFRRGKCVWSSQERPINAIAKHLKLYDIR